MTRETYCMMMEQMGKEINLDELPPEIHNFPDDVQKAIFIFNKLGDKIVADIGYLGKDYTALSLHMKANNVENEQLFLETLSRLDARVIEKSAEAMKRERDRIKAMKKG